MAARSAFRSTARRCCRMASVAIKRGRYDSLGGPLYVNVGIGTYMFPVRFNCRPEITVVQSIDSRVFIF